MFPWRPSPFRTRAGWSVGAGAFLLSPRSVHAGTVDAARQQPGHGRLWYGAHGLPYPKNERAPPYLGPSRGVRPCGARKARRFSPRKSLKNGPLRYALTRRPEQSGGTHPLKGVRPEKIQRKRGQKNEIHHQEENETGKADRLRRPKAYVPTRAKT